MNQIEKVARSDGYRENTELASMSKEDILKQLEELD